VQAETLVLHRLNEQFVPPQAARYIAEKIPGAQLAYLDGLDHYPWLGPRDDVLDAIGTFLTGRDPAPSTVKAVLLTDIVRSTQQLLEHGEDRWNDVLTSHDAIVEENMAASGGTLIKLTGDGVVAVFDHPADALRCAVQLRDAIAELGLKIRTGVTVGDIVFRPTDVTGIAVHIAERLAKMAEPGQILVSRGVTVLLAESSFGWLGARSLRGVPGDRSVFELR
jgi:class 3 adenylate cyclase